MDKFRIEVWEGGYPIWAEIFYKDKIVAHLNALELRYLQFTVQEARREARRKARQMGEENWKDY